MGGYATSHQNNLELYLGSHTCWLSYLTLVCLWCGRTCGRSVGRTVTWLPKFLGWVDNHLFLGMGLRWCALCARVELRYAHDGVDSNTQTNFNSGPVMIATIPYTRGTSETIALIYNLVAHKPLTTLRRPLTNVKDKDKPEDIQGAVYKIKCCECQATCHRSLRNEISCGVSQGFILGPQFFLLYINDINNGANLLNLILFADDTNVFMSYKDLNYLSDMLNLEMVKLSIWFKANKLSLNLKILNLWSFTKTEAFNL